MKTALITGISSGIGASLASLLSSKGYRVFGVSRHPENLSYPSVPYNIEAVTLSINQEQPDLFIHSAGFGWYGSSLSQDDKEFCALWEVHMHSLFLFSRAFMRMCTQQNKQGTFLAISSIAGEIPMPGMAAYGAMKAAMTQFCQALDYEYRNHMRVLVCCPGMVNTPFASRASGSPFVHSAWTISANQAAKEIWKQIQKGQKKRIIDWRYRWLHPLISWLPQRWVFPFIYRSVMQRIPPCAPHGNR